MTKENKGPMTPPTGGTFTLSIGRYKTEPIPANASPEEIQAEIDRLADKHRDDPGFEKALDSLD